MNYATYSSQDLQTQALAKKPGAYLRNESRGFAIFRLKDGKEVRSTGFHPDEITAWSEAANRISIRELADNAGFDSKMEFLEECCADSVVPACCQHGCEVEPDGRCEHGCPSALIAAGMI